MRAFIEYPEVSDDRIEIKSEFVVQTQDHYHDEMLYHITRGLQPITDAAREQLKSEKRAGLDEKMAQDIYDDGTKTVDGIEMEPKQPRYRGDDQYWKDEC